MKFYKEHLDCLSQTNYQLDNIRAKKENLPFTSDEYRDLVETEIELCKKQLEIINEIN